MNSVAWILGVKNSKGVFFRYMVNEYMDVSCSLCHPMEGYLPEQLLNRLKLGSLFKFPVTCQ